MADDSFLEELDSELSRIKKEISSSRLAGSEVKTDSASKTGSEVKNNPVSSNNPVSNSDSKAKVDSPSQVDLSVKPAPQIQVNSEGKVDSSSQISLSVGNDSLNQISSDSLNLDKENLPLVALLVFEGGVGGITIPDSKKRLATRVLPNISAKGIYLAPAGYNSFEESIQALRLSEQKVRMLLSVQNSRFISLIELIKLISKTIDETPGCEGVFIILDMAANEIKSADNTYYLGSDARRFGAESNEGFISHELLIEYYQILATDYHRLIIIENGFAVEDSLAWRAGRLALKNIGLLPDRRIIKLKREEIYKENYFKEKYLPQTRGLPHFYGTDFLLSPKTNVEFRVSRTTLASLMAHFGSKKSGQKQEGAVYSQGSLGASLSYTPKKTFMGTSGFRGKVNDMRDFEPYVVAYGFIQWLLKKGQYKIDENTKSPERGQSMLLAGDFRDSTPSFMAAAAKAINDCGIKVVYLGKIATPVLAFYSKTIKLPGIMVTGSHTEGQYNGLKLYDFDGEVLNEPEPEDKGISDREGIMQEVNMVREQLYSEQLSISCFDENGYFKSEKKFDLDSLVTDEKAKENYVRRYTSAFSKKPFEGYAIVYWEHSTVAAGEHTAILEGLGMKVLPIGRRADAFVALDTENMTPAHLEYLSQKIGETKEKYCGKNNPDGKVVITIDAKEYILLGLTSSDGDGDRSLIVDEKGQFWRGDVTGAIIAQTLGAEMFVQSLTGSQDVEEYLAKCNPPIKLRKCSVGSPYHVFVMRDLLKTNSSLHVIGQEVNGGAFVGPHFKLPLAEGEISELLTRDAILPTLVVLLRSIIDNAPVSKLFEGQLDHYADCAGLIHEMPVKPGTDRTGIRLLKRYTPDSKLGIKEVNFNDEKQEAVLEYRAQTNFEVISYSDQFAAGLIGLRKDVAGFFNETKGFGKIVKMAFGDRIEDGIVMWDSNKDRYHVRPSGNAPEIRIYVYSAQSKKRAEEIVEISIKPGGILMEMERAVWNPEEILSCLKE